MYHILIIFLPKAEPQGIHFHLVRVIRPLSVTGIGALCDFEPWILDGIDQYDLSCMLVRLNS